VQVRHCCHFHAQHARSLRGPDLSVGDYLNTGASALPSGAYLQQLIRAFPLVISTLVAFGNDVFSILNRNFKGEFNVLKVPHYSAYTNKETYREQVREAMAKFG